MVQSHALDLRLGAMPQMCLEEFFQVRTADRDVRDDLVDGDSRAGVAADELNGGHQIRLADCHDV